MRSSETGTRTLTLLQASVSLVGGERGELHVEMTKGIASVAEAWVALPKVTVTRIYSQLGNRTTPGLPAPRPPSKTTLHDEI